MIILLATASSGSTVVAGTKARRRALRARTTLPRRAQVGEDQDPETRARAKEKIKGRTRLVPTAQGDLEQEMVHQEDAKAIVLLPLAGPLLPPTGSKFEEPPRVAKRIARYVPFI